MKILSYNIQDGGIGRESFILKAIEQFDTDVLILQEVTNIRLVEEISAKGNMFLYVAQGNGRRNLALLSKYRLSYFKSFHPFLLKHTLLEAKLNRGHQEVSFFGIHLAAYPFVPFEIWRMLEIYVILSRAKRLEVKNIIMCGDFNSVAPSDSIPLNRIPGWMKVILILTQAGRFPRCVIKKLHKAGLLDCYRKMNNDAGYTLPALNPHIRLDYFFISQSLKDKINKCQVVMEPDILKLASDHLPILLDIDI